MSEIIGMRIWGTDNFLLKRRDPGVDTVRCAYLETLRLAMLRHRRRG